MCDRRRALFCWYPLLHVYIYRHFLSTWAKDSRALRTGSRDNGNQETITFMGEKGLYGQWE